MPDSNQESPARAERERLEHLCDEWPGDYSYPEQIISDVQVVLEALAASEEKGE